MLADVLEEARGELLRRAGACADRGRASGLLTKLVAALRRPGGEWSPRCEQPFGTEAESMLGELKMLKEAIYGLLDERAIAVSAGEMRQVAEWFAALTERILRQQNRRFTTMLDAIPDHVALHDRASHPVYLNRSAQLDLEAAVGTPVGDSPLLVSQSLPEPILKQAQEEFARAARGESVTAEILFPTADGLRWHEHHVSPVLGSDGEVDGIVVASRDIHARKQAEARLQLLSKVGELAEAMDHEDVVSAVARLSIPELADWCVVDVIEDGRCRRTKVAHRDPTKTALAEELQLQVPQMENHPKWHRLLAGESLLITDLSDEEMRRRGAPDTVRELVGKLGARSALMVPFVVLGSTVAVANFFFTSESERVHGEADRVLGEELARRAAQIIENARLHQQLRQSETRFRVALAHSNIAVFEEDTEFRVRWVYNPLFGMEASEALGKSGADLALSSSSAELTALKRSVLDLGERVRTEVDAVVGGERRHLLLNYEPLRDASGIVGLMGAAVDMTEAKLAQEELAQELVFRERMMGVLGHDLRNPLGAVLGLSSLLSVQELPGNAHEHVSQIQQSARRMNEMIERLLDITRLRQRQHLGLERQHIDLLELSRTVVDELKAAHPAREIRLQADGDVRGHWDPARIEQVASNLVANALTHGHAESPVDLSLAGDDDEVRLEVSNRGEPIDPDLIDHLFEPFRQGAHRTKGLGLGLFIVRKLVLAHGGSVEVRSNDEATTFTVRLPRQPQASANGTAEQPTPVAG